MNKQLRRYSDNIYNGFRLLFIGLLASAVEGGILRLLNFNNNDAFWLWGAWLICGFTVCFCFHAISKILQDRYETFSKIILICSSAAWLLGIVQSTLGLIG